jgi:hypothetical protein
MRDLTLLIAKTKPIKGDKERLIKYIGEIQDWNMLIQYYKENSLIPLFYHHLVFHELIHHLPSEQFKKIKNLREQLTYRNLKILNTFKHLHKTLNHYNIEHVALKGTVLAVLLYNDIGLRPMVDIDMLIHHNDIPKIDKIMSQWNAKSLKEGNIKFIRDRHRHIPGFIFNGVLIEFHTNIVDDYSPEQVSAGTLWKVKQSHQLYNLSVHVLDKEWLLYSLCVHLYNHLKKGIVKIIWFVDIIEYIHIYFDTINYLRFLEISESTNAANEIKCVMYLAHNYFYALIPSVLLDENIKIPHNIMTIFDLHLIGKKKSDTSHHITSIKQLSIPDSIKYYVSMLLPSIGFIKRKYPSIPLLIPFFYLHRIGKIGFKTFVLLITYPFRKK